MDVWMISRRELNNDLPELFEALGNLQYQFDWVVSDHHIWYSPNCPEEVKKRWQWAGLLISGRELTEHLQKKYITFCFGAVLSAVPLGTKPEQVWNHVPGWEVDFSDANYQFQTPVTELEIICFDGYAWVIICKPDFSELVRRCLPQAMPPEQWYEAHTQVRYDEHGNKMSVIQ